MDLWKIFKRHPQATSHKGHNRDHWLAHFKLKFFQTSHHQWIADDFHLSRVVWQVLENLNREQLKTLCSQYQLLVLRGSGRMALSVGTTENVRVILAFPELVEMLNMADPGPGQAVLAHELGHVLLNHSYRSIDPLEAQVEADSFAFGLGFGEELASVLDTMPESMEKSVRITYLTSKIIAQKYDV